MCLYLLRSQHLSGDGICQTYRWPNRSCKGNVSLNDTHSPFEEGTPRNKFSMVPENDDFPISKGHLHSFHLRKICSIIMRGSSKRVNLTLVWRSGVILTGVFPLNTGINHASESKKQVSLSETKLYHILSMYWVFTPLGTYCMLRCTLQYKNISTNSDLAAGQNPFPIGNISNNAVDFLGNNFLDDQKTSNSPPKSNNKPKK